MLKMLSTRSNSKRKLSEQSQTFKNRSASLNVNLSFVSDQSLSPKDDINIPSISSNPSAIDETIVNKNVLTADIKNKISEQSETFKNRSASLNVNLSFVSDQSLSPKDDINIPSISSNLSTIYETIVNKKVFTAAIVGKNLSVRKHSPKRFVTCRRTANNINGASNNIDHEIERQDLTETPKLKNHRNIRARYMSLDKKSPFDLSTQRRPNGKTCTDGHDRMSQDETIIMDATMDFTQVQGRYTNTNLQNYRPVHSTLLTGSDDSISSARTSLNVNTSIDSRFSPILNETLDVNGDINLKNIIHNEEDATESTCLDLSKDVTMVRRNKSLSSLHKSDGISDSQEIPAGKNSVSTAQCPNPGLKIISNEIINDIRCQYPKVILNNERRDKPDESKRGRKKLLPLSNWSDVASFSPICTEDEAEMKIVRKKRLNKTSRPIKTTRDKRFGRAVSSDEENEPKLQTIKPKAKKVRRVISKTIVVKRPVHLLKLVDDVQSQNELTTALKQTSLDDFEEPSENFTQNTVKRPKIFIVTTGLTREEIMMAKCTAQTLGSAKLEKIVTKRTTHVISKGIRTTNVLRCIVRGCWLVSPAWISACKDAGKWLDPENFELRTFSKAVQESRKERQLFGSAYVSELFLTCGPIYVEENSIPSAAILRELVKTASGQISDKSKMAKIIVGPNGFKEIWILDSITNGEVQPLELYTRK